MRARYFWPVFLIVAGVLLLLDNLGLLPGNAWNWLWPLLLIWLGFNMLTRGQRAPLETTEDSLPLEGAASARLTLRHGAGRLELYTGSNPALLYSGSFGGGVDPQVQRSGNQLEVTLRPTQRDWTEWMWPGNWSNGGLNWSLGLTPAVPLTLSLETGASDNRLDLSGLRVSDLTIKTGASSTEVTVPAQAGHTRARIESGAASVKVTVPNGVAARIKGHVGAGALNVDQGRFPRRGDEYESSDFASAANRVELSIESGAGEISVR